MALVGEIHVVPSGKVYRQIFDAEVQLVRSLGEARARIGRQELGLDSGKFPPIRNAETHSGGLLSHRQRVWGDSMAYDGFTENPLTYREKTASTLKKTPESEDLIAAREVRGLLDVIVPEKKDSGILQRITSSRQGRHNAAVSSLQRELTDISKAMEAMVLEVGNGLQEKISESDKKIDLLFHQHEDRADNENFTVMILNQLWDQVAEESSCRKQWIRDTENALYELEEKRANQIADVLKKFTSLLRDIGYLVASDVYRFIHKEAMMINQAVLANHRAIAKLSLNLMEAELKREQSQRLRWQDLIKALKCYQKDIILEKFREFIKNEIDQTPDRMIGEADWLLGQCRPLHDERLQLLCSIRDLIPPMCSETAVTDWHKSILAFNKKLDSVHREFLDKVYSLKQEAIQRCMLGAEKSKAQLLETDICTEEEAEIILSKELSPVVEYFQATYDKEQKLFSENIKTVAKQMEAQINVLFKFAKNAVHLWEGLKVGLAQQENTLQEKLEKCSMKHETENQVKEANLDIILDTLRQESTREQLDVLLQKAQSCLQDIRSGYKKFHDSQVVISESYPAMVLAEISAYSSSVSKYFHCKEVYGQDIPLKTEESGYIEAVSPEPSKSSRVPEPAALPQGVIGYSDLSQDNHTEYAAVNAPPNPEGETPRDDGENVVGTPMQESSKQIHMDNEDNSAVDSATKLFEMSSSAEKIPEANPVLENFTTARGNTYTVLQEYKEPKTKPSMNVECAAESVFFTEAVTDDECPLNLDLKPFPEELISDLKKQIRLGFYNHLESWFDDMVSQSRILVLAKKDKLKSELELCYHLHQPRSQAIQMDIYNVRAAELLLHAERVDHHCEGIKEALSHLKQESATLVQRMNSESDNFRSKISAMESVFLNATKSEKLVTLTNSLPSVLDSHVAKVQTAMRSYRQHVEEMLGNLCDTNSDFIRSFRLFSEGGNFSPAEIEDFRKQLHRASATVTSFEASIMVDLEGLESQCLEQATEVVKKFEERFLNLTADMIFLESIQKLLTNLQVQIKALVMSSNTQSQQINCYLEQLQVKTDACVSPNMDKEAVTSDDLYAFVKTVMEAVKKRSQFLSCLLDPGPVLCESPLQGPIAAASRADVAFGTPDSLLIPSRMGKQVIDDTAVSVIKSIMKTQKTNGPSPHRQEDGQPRQTAVTGSNQSLSIVPRPPSRPSSGNKHVRKLVKPTRLDKKYQVFGEKKEESDHFKGMLTSILWESNDNLLYLAEEFYKKKERRPIGRPDLLQETFEDCADTLVMKLQSYEKQALDYYNNCLLEFREQLVQFESLMSEVPPIVIENQRRQHLETMHVKIQHTQQLFKKDLDAWEKTKEERRNLLRPSLGHPNNHQVLEEICQQEERRQEEEVEGIERNSKQLQDCVSESMQHFAASLASLAENLLLELDESLTVDDVLTAKKEVPKQKLSTLIRRKRDGLPLEETDNQTLVERGIRVWPGISLKESTDAAGCLATASITTAKTTLSHFSTLEARDAAYKTFLQDTEKALARIREERTQLLLSARRWKEWWQHSILKIKELYI